MQIYTRKFDTNTQKHTRPSRSPRVVSSFISHQKTPVNTPSCIYIYICIYLGIVYRLAGGPVRAYIGEIRRPYYFSIDTTYASRRAPCYFLLFVSKSSSITFDRRRDRHVNKRVTLFLFVRARAVYRSRYNHRLK